MSLSITNPSTTCKECGREFDLLRGLHNHVARKEQGLESYYHKHYPRRDLYTKDLIGFKDASSYCKSFFNSTANEKKWVLENNAEEWYKFKINRLIKRPHHKYSYSWVEWVSMGNLEFQYLENFERILSYSGLKNRYDYSVEKTIKDPLEESFILVDTREQRPLINKEKTSINVGDYTADAAFYNNVHIDRKSLPDFISTFTTGIDRFEREAEKAKNLGVNLIVLVESSFYNCLAFRPNRFGQKTNGKLAFVGVRKLIQKYDNLQFLFVEDRGEAKFYLGHLLSNPELIKKDLQYLYYVERGVSL